MPGDFHDLINEGRDQAEQHYPALAALYEREIRRLGREAANRFQRHQWATPAPIAAAGTAPPDWHLPHPDEIMNPVKAAIILRGKGEPIRQLVAQTTIAGTLASYGVAFHLNNPLLQHVFGQMGNKITNITESIRADVMAAIQESYDKGLSIRDTSAAIRSHVNDISKYRGEMIARTEMTQATSGASYAAAKLVDKASGAYGGMRKIWIATEDDRTRDAHIEAADTYGEGSGIPLDQPFIVDDEPLMYPGDDGSPENVINCRCTIGYEQAPQSTAEAVDATPTPEEMGPEEVAPLLGQAFANAPELESNVVAYRGLTYRLREGMGPGGVVRDEGQKTFMSTTTSRAVAEGYAGGHDALAITIPKGERTLWMPKMAAGRNAGVERELLLAPTKDRFMVVTRVEDLAEGGKLYHVELRTSIGTPLKGATVEGKRAETILDKQFEAYGTQAERDAATMYSGIDGHEQVNKLVAAKPEILKPPPSVDSMSDAQVDAELGKLATEPAPLGFEALGPDAYDSLADEARRLGDSDLLAALRGEGAGIQKQHAERMNYFVNRGPNGELRAVVSLAEHTSAKQTYRIAGVWGPAIVDREAALLGAVRAAAADGKILVYAGKDERLITFLEERGFKVQVQGGGGVRHMVLGKRAQVGFLREAGVEPPKVLRPRAPESPPRAPERPPAVEPSSRRVIYQNDTYTIRELAHVDDGFSFSTADDVPQGAKGGTIYSFSAKDGHQFDVFVEDGYRGWERELAHVADTITSFPAERSKLQKIGFFNGKNPGDYAAGVRYGYKDPSKFVSAATARGGRMISFWLGRVGTGDFEHEMGHIIGREGLLDLVTSFDARETGAIIDALGENLGRWERFTGGPTGPKRWVTAARSDMVNAAANVGEGASPRAVVSLGGSRLTLGRMGVTEYGNVAIQEDWAESVRLYMLQRSNGYIAYTSRPGLGTTRYTFEQLFPARAKILDQLFGGSAVVASGVGGEGAVHLSAVGGVLDDLDGIAVVGLDDVGVGPSVRGGLAVVESADLHGVDDNGLAEDRHDDRQAVTERGVTHHATIRAVSKGNPVTPVRMTPEQRDRVRQFAEEHDITVSEAIRRATDVLIDGIDLEASLMRTPADFAPGDPPADDPTNPEGPTDDPSTLDQLADVAAQIVHCSDYGDAYWNATTGDVWWEACDGDPYPAEPGGGPNGEDVPAGTSFDDITSMFMAVDGVQSVTIEAENPPPDDGSYVPVIEEGDGGDVSPPAPAGASVDADGFKVLGGMQAFLPDDEELASVVVPAEGEPGDSPPPAPPTGDGVPFRATLAIEGKPTDDGRIIDKGALTWRELPLTLMAIVEDSHGGMPQTRTAVSGRIDQIERVDTGDDTADIIGTGVFDTGEIGTEIARLVSEKMLRGVSIDLAISAAEDRENPDAPEGDPTGGLMFAVTAGTIMGATVCPFAAFGDADIEAVLAAALEAATLPTWRIPLTITNDDGAMTRIAFLGTFDVIPADDVPEAPSGDNGGGMIALYPQPDEASALADPDGNIPAEGLHLTLLHLPELADGDLVNQTVEAVAQGYGALAGSVGGAGAFGAGEDDEANPGAPQVLLIDTPGLSDLRCDLARAFGEAGIDYSTNHDFTPHVTIDYDDPADLAHEQGLIGKPVTFTALSIVSEAGDRRDVPLAAALTAAAAGFAPLTPPSEWFDYPDGVDGLTPVTVTPEGRVFGHIAAFNECHIGSPAGKCITAPHHYRAGDVGCAVCGEREGNANHSQSGYDFFHLGELETAEGDLVKVGQVTLGTSHAPMSTITAKMAQEHYDNTGVSAADGVIYEDDIGPFFTGALRPDMPANRVREFRAAKPSGDWRGIRGRRELIGVLMVNKPGFPVPRRATGTDHAGEQRELALVAAGFPDPEYYGTQPCDSGEMAEQLAALVAEGRGQMSVADEVSDLIASAKIDNLIREAKQ